MFKQITLRNVRGFEGSSWQFNLRPLTIFCGTNGAGKSTALKSLLLLKQSSTYSDPHAQSPGRPRFTGTYTDLGTYATFVSENRKSEGLSIGVVIEDDMPVEIYEDLSHGHARDKRRSKEETLPYELRCCVDIGYIDPRRGHQELEKEIPDGDIEVIPSRTQRKAYFKKIQWRISAKGQQLLDWCVTASAASRGAQFHVEVPRSVLEGFPRAQKAASPKSSRAMARFDCSIRGFTLNYLLSPQSGGSQRTGHSMRRPLPVPSIVQDAEVDMLMALGRLRYIAPLRSAGKRYYIAEMDVSTIHDPTGEQVPFVIRDRGDMFVSNWRINGNSRTREKLIDALRYWLNYLRTGRTSVHPPTGEVAVQSSEDVLLQFSVKGSTGKEPHALADSGFGYSQVLPILTKVLVADEPSTFIIEQPELHLNPALQVRLAEFFVAMMRLNKQLLIETHSEHIVNTIRAMCAEDSDGELASRTQLYYVGVAGARPHVHELTIQPDGTVPDWPPDFFGESLNLTGRILRAQKKHLLGSSQ